MMGEATDDLSVETGYYVDISVDMDEDGDMEVTGDECPQVVRSGHLTEEPDTVCTSHSTR